MPPKRSTKLTRQQERDLDIEIRFIEGVVCRAPEFIEALQILGDDYTRRGRFADGLKLDEQLARLRPDDALVHYNLACSYSLAEQFAAAPDTIAPSRSTRAKTPSGSSINGCCHMNLELLPRVTFRRLPAPSMK